MRANIVVYIARELEHDHVRLRILPSFAGCGSCVVPPTVSWIKRHQTTPIVIVSGRRDRASRIPSRLPVPGHRVSIRGSMLVPQLVFPALRSRDGNR